MKYRKSILSAAIVTSLAFGAHAQDATQQPQATATDLDTVQVVGIRASLEKSLDTKRNNVTISEAITAEDIGKFPSTNVAEAMAQIPSPGALIASKRRSAGTFRPSPAAEVDSSVGSTYWPALFFRSAVVKSFCSA